VVPLIQSVGFERAVDEMDGAGLAIDVRPRAVGRRRSGRCLITEALPRGAGPASRAPRESSSPALRRLRGLGARRCSMPRPSPYPG
jgi:hypothetical protein